MRKLLTCGSGLLNQPAQQRQRHLAARRRWWGGPGCGSGPEGRASLLLLD